MATTKKTQTQEKNSKKNTRKTSPKKVTVKTKRTTKKVHPHNFAISKIEHNAAISQSHHHMSSSHVIGVILLGIFAVFMSYDFYFIYTHTTTLVDTMINFILHFGIFGVFFYGIYWVIAKMK